MIEVAAQAEVGVRTIVGEACLGLLRFDATVYSYWLTGLNL